MGDDTIEVSISTTANADSDSGTYPIVVSAGTSKNYEITLVNGSCHILDTEFNVNINGYYEEYDGKNHSISVEVSGEGSENIAVYYSTDEYTTAAEVIGNASSVSPARLAAGTTKVYYYLVENGEIVVTGSRNITIAKKKLYVTANEHTIIFGQEPSNDGVTYSGFADGEDERVLSGNITYIYDYVAGSEPGEYSIKPSGLAAGNYNIIYVAGKLTVMPVKQTLVINVVSKEEYIYNSLPQPGYIGSPMVEGNLVSEFTYKYFDEDENPLSEAPKDAGKYSVVISIPENNKLYKGSKEVKFEIKKKEIIVKAQSQAIFTGTFDENTFIPLAALYIGFEGNDNEGNKAIATPAVINASETTDFDNEGTYEILVTNIGSLTEEAVKNYKLAAKKGTLTIIEKAEPASQQLPDATGSVVEIGSNGSVQTLVIFDDTGLPRLALEANLTPAKAQGLLGEDVDSVMAGEDALVYLVVSAADITRNSDDVASINNMTENMNEDISVGLFLDVSLFKQVGSQEPKQISETSGNTKATITLQIPENIKNTDENIERKYTIIYCHNGAVKTIIPQKIDDTLVFDAFEFSTYAIGYTDVQRIVNPPHNNTDVNPVPYIIVPAPVDETAENPTDTEEGDADIDDTQDGQDNEDEDDGQDTEDENGGQDIEDDNRDADDENDNRDGNDTGDEDDGHDVRNTEDNGTDNQGRNDGNDSLDNDSTKDGDGNNTEDADEVKTEYNNNENDLNNDSRQNDDNNSAQSDGDENSSTDNSENNSEIGADKSESNSASENPEDSRITDEEDCYMHYINLILSLLAILAAILLKNKKEAYRLVILSVTLLVEIIIAITGKCKLDWIFVIPYAIIAIALYLWLKKKDSGREDAEPIK